MRSHQRITGRPTMNTSRELKRAFGAARRRGLGEDEAKKLAIVDLLATLGLAVLPEEGLRAALERLRETPEGTEHAEAIRGLLVAPRPCAASWCAWRLAAMGEGCRGYLAEAFPGSEVGEGICGIRQPEKYLFG